MAKSKVIVISIVVLRILTLLTCAATIALIVTNNYTINGQKTNFTAIRGFWYILSAAGVGILYSLIQLPFALYHAVKGKRLIKGQFLPMFDFYGDKVISFILASGVGVGIGVSIELKKSFDESIDELEGGTAIELLEEFREKSDKFFGRGIIATAILFAGFTTMAILSILNSAKRTGKGF